MINKRSFLGLDITTQIRANGVADRFHEAPFDILAPLAFSFFDLPVLPRETLLMRSWLRGAGRILFPSMVVGLVCQVTDADLSFQLAQVVPRDGILQPAVQQTLVDGVALPLLHLQQVVDEINGG